MSENQAIGDLPEWDLSDLYPAMDSPAVERDIEAARTAAQAFEKRHKGNVANYPGADLAAAIAEYERLEETLSRLLSYAGLQHAGNMSDPEVARFYQHIQENVTDISSYLVFFTLEINRIDDADLNAKLEVVGLATYAPWLRDIRALRPHQLSDELERLLHEKSVTGHAAWTRLFDETMARLRFPLDGKELTSAEVLDLLSDPNADKRKAAAATLGQVLGDNLHVFSFITNTLAKDKEIEDRWRRFARPVSRRNLENHVEDEVVQALVSAVKDAYPRLSHRYYALKARWFGKDQLDHWDRNAPMPDADEDVFPWTRAVDTVLDAYSQFSPQLAEIGQRFFDNRWIDGPVRPGKAPGAFAHPTVPSSHPYLLLNYQGKTRDVMTLAHELGHGVHQVLAAKQGHLMADTPLTLAETASVFGEMLTFRKLLADTKDQRQRRNLLAGKVEDMLNTVVRQTAFFEFEERVHDRRHKGELLATEISDIWIDIQTESLGPAIRFDEGYRSYWSYIPHFIHSPFYVYAYAFGDCLVNSLYARYEQAHEGFAGRYLEMLSAAGTLRHKELLAPFGLDASRPEFWQQGLAMIGGFIDELEELA